MPDIVEEARELFKDASPRPWLVEIHDARGDYAKIVLISRNGYFETGYYVIADDDMECRREQTVADFKAIARAPELLASLCDEVEKERSALLRITREALRFRVEVNGPCNHDEYMTKLCTQCELREAIENLDHKE